MQKSSPLEEYRLAVEISRCAAPYGAWSLSPSFPSAYALGYHCFARVAG